MKGLAQLKTGYLSSIRELNKDIDEYILASGKLKKILFVDDEKMTLKYLEKYFRHKIPGAKVFFSDSPIEAKKILIENEIDLLITDLKMPILHGREIAALAKKLNPDTRIIIITAYLDEIVDDLKNEEYFLKPIVDLNILYQSVLRNLSFHGYAL